MYAEIEDKIKRKCIPEALEQAKFIDFNQPISSRSSVCQTFFRAAGFEEAHNPMELDTSTIPSSDISTKPTSLQHPLPAPDTQFLSTIPLDTDLSRADNDTFELDELHELTEDELRNRYHAMISQQKSFQAVVFKAAKKEAKATITRKIAQLINEQ